MFHQNSKEKKDRTGVAIVIAPNIAKMRRDDGENDAITISQFEGRFIGISIKFPEFDTKGRRIRTNGRDSSSRQYTIRMMTRTAHSIPN